MSILRVCHLIKGLGRGGAEALLPQTIRASGGDVRYTVGYFLPWKDALVPELEAAGVAVRCFEARSNARLLTRSGAVARWLREEQADLVHAHLPLAGVVARLAGRRAGVPVVYTEHNLLERYHPLTRWANLATWRLQSAVVTVSAEVAASARRRTGDRVPLTVVRNGIEVARYRADAAARRGARQRLGIPEEAEVVGTVAVFRVQKRLDLWLQAAASIAAELPRSRFLLVGDGPERGRAEELATELGLAQKVIFVGLQPDVVPYLAAMDLFLISSEFEGLPLALLEAMAAGLPVVTTSVGGIPEVIDSDSTGIMVPFGQAPGALSRAVLALLADPSQQRRLGEGARRRVEAEFGVARMAGELEALYRKVIAGRAVSRPDPPDS